MSRGLTKIGKLRECNFIDIRKFYQLEKIILPRKGLRILLSY